MDTVVFTNVKNVETSDALAQNAQVLIKVSHNQEGKTNGVFPVEKVDIRNCYD